MLANVHSYYSLRYGTLSIRQLVDGLVQRGYDTAVLTDINNSTGSLEFIKACQMAGIKGLAGIEFRNGDKLLYICIAKNESGFKELNDFQTYANKHKTAHPELAPAFRQVQVIYPFGKHIGRPLLAHEFIGVRHLHLNKIRLSSAASMNKYVLWQPVSFTNEHGYKLHTQLRAIDHNILISQLKPHQYADRLEVFPSKNGLLEKFRDFPQVIANTEKLLGECTFTFDFSAHRNKLTFTGNREDDKRLLRKYAMEGFSSRYKESDKVAITRINHELKIIDELNFSVYFLINDDICRYARSRGFAYVGRGSGANSAVAYCLHITDVCPIELNLPFERFLNPKRKSAPDFDIDVRHEVAQFEYG